jgi:hypothetical protein
VPVIGFPATGELLVSAAENRSMPTQPDESAIPEWAVAKASAALKVGMSVPDIERMLVAKGLSPKAATAVLNFVLEGRVQEQAPVSAALPEPSEGELRLHRIASAVVACLCLVLAYPYGGGYSVGRTMLVLLLPVACIWWTELMESTTPPAIVRWAAWVVLLLIVGYRFMLLSAVLGPGSKW